MRPPSTIGGGACGHRTPQPPAARRHGRGRPRQPPSRCPATASSMASAASSSWVTSVIVEQPADGHATGRDPGRRRAQRGAVGGHGLGRVAGRCERLVIEGEGRHRHRLGGVVEDRRRHALATRACRGRRGRGRRGGRRAAAALPEARRVPRRRRPADRHRPGTTGARTGRPTRRSRRRSIARWSWVFLVAGPGPRARRVAHSARRDRRIPVPLSAACALPRTSGPPRRSRRRPRHALTSPMSTSWPTHTTTSSSTAPRVSSGGRPSSRVTRMAVQVADGRGRRRDHARGPGRRAGRPPARASGSGWRTTCPRAERRARGGASPAWTTRRAAMPPTISPTTQATRIDHDGVGHGPHHPQDERRDGVDRDGELAVDGGHDPHRSPGHGDDERHVGSQPHAQDRPAPPPPRGRRGHRRGRQPAVVVRRRPRRTASASAAAASSPPPSSQSMPAAPTTTTRSTTVGVKPAEQGRGQDRGPRGWPARWPSAAR